MNYLLVTAALLATLVSPGRTQIALEQDKEKCAESAFAAVGGSKSLLLRKIGEKTLGQIRRVVPTVAALAHKPVKRRPVIFIQSSKRDSRFSRSNLSSG